jgi:glutamine amidotransferase
MCELLGMSSNHSTTINLSLTTLAERGENPRLHGDGWGVAFYEQNAVRLIKDSGEAKASEWVKFIKSQEIASHDIIAHIRKSTVGEVSYRNTHPFIRELGGVMHTFAHNGTLEGIQTHPDFQPSHYHPIGTTDSEHAFCCLMDRMRGLWPKDGTMPPLEDRLELVVEFAREMRGLGTINFLYSDGDTLFAHGHRRHDPITDKVSWPGLHYIQVHCADDGSEGFKRSTRSSIAVRGAQHTVTLFASVPLNEQPWIPLKEGEVIAVTKGEQHRHRMS